MMTLNPGVRAARRKGLRAWRGNRGAARVTAPLEPHTPPPFFETTTLNRATVPSFGWLTLSITGRCMDLFGVIVHSSQQSPLHP